VNAAAVASASATAARRAPTRPTCSAARKWPPAGRFRFEWSRRPKP